MDFSAFTSKLFGKTETKAAPVFSDWGLGFALTPSSISGVAVNATTAMGVPAVSAAVNLIASSIGNSAARIMRTIEETKTEATEHQAARIVSRRASSRHSAGKLRELLAFDALLHGNGFAFVNRVGGRVVEILRLDPHAVSVTVDQFLEPTYRVAGRVIDPAEIIHIPAPVSFDGVNGVAPIKLAREAIALAITMEARAAKLFGTSARPSGVIEVPGGVGAETVQKIRVGWAAAHEGIGNAAKTAILHEGATFNALEFKSTDAQFLEMRVQQTIEIARAFDVPATMLGELSRGAFKNLEEQNRQFLQFCLSPWLTTFKDEFERVLLADDEHDEFSIEFNTDAIVTIDAAAHADKIAKLRSAGVLTSNDARRELNLPALPGGDELTSPHVATGATPAPKPVERDVAEEAAT